jgi:hypothetical protein
MGMIFDDSFDWTELGDEEIVMPQQLETAVYRNAANTITIRQRGWPDDDVLLTIAPEFAEKLCAAVMRIAGEITGDDDDADADRAVEQADETPEPTPAPRRAKPRTQYEGESASRTKPWETFGWSRRTWERRGKPDASADASAAVDADASAITHQRDTNDCTIDLPFAPPIDPVEEEEASVADQN